MTANPWTRLLRSARLAERPAAPIALFALVVAAFLAVGMQQRAQLEPADRDADRISRDAAPGIELLAGIRSEARTLQLLVSNYLANPTKGNGRDIDAALSSLHERLGNYFALPTLPGEAELTLTLQRRQAALEASVGDALAQPGATSVAMPPERRVASAVTELNDVTSRLIAAKADQSARLAIRISAIHRHVERVGFALDVTCLALAAFAGLVAYRLRVQNDALVRARVSFAEERAEELDLFASRVAHDIRSPLQAAKLSFDLLQRKPREPAEAKPLLDRAARCVDRVLRLTDALLDFARSGARPASGEEADVAEVVGDVVAELEPVAEEARISLAVSSAVAGTVTCSAGALTSVVSNLVRNAIKYMGDATERWIDVRVSKGLRTLRVEVEDTGPGVSPELGAAIFELYARGATAQPGLGLGLATAKRLVDAHGGRIGFRARHGRGTVFWIELPSANVSERTRRAERTSSAPPEGGHRVV
jgi:signal transduction histidine kinase